MKETALAPDTYEYCLVVNGHQVPDPLTKETVPNPVAGSNEVLKSGWRRSLPSVAGKLQTVRQDIKSAKQRREHLMDKFDIHDTAGLTHYCANLGSTAVADGSWRMRVHRPKSKRPEWADRLFHPDYILC